MLSQELANGAVDTYTARAGVETSPWSGAQLKSGVNQELSESGVRNYSNLGFVQSIKLSKHWGMDFAFDMVETLDDEVSSQTPFDPNHPPASGGLLGSNTFSEDYQSGSLGLNYKKDKWSWNARAEVKTGEQEDRVGFQTNISHELKEGVVLSNSIQYLSSEFIDGSEGQSIESDFSLAYRPRNSRWSLLDRFTFRHEEINNPGGLDIFGVNTSAGSDFKSTTFINNLNVNRISRDRKNQFSVYYGSKYTVDSFEGAEYSGYTDMLGFEVRQHIGKRFDIGLHAYSLNSWESSVHKYAVGPSIGVSPAKNTWISLGYNFGGFHDADFDDSRYTREGVFLKFRFRFDEHTLGLDSKKQKEMLDETCEIPIIELPQREPQHIKEPLILELPTPEYKEPVILELPDIVRESKIRPGLMNFSLNHRTEFTIIKKTGDS